MTKTFFGSADGSERENGRKPLFRAVLPTLPFFIFCLLFLILPALTILSGAFFDSKGRFTLANFVNLFTPNIVSSYAVSIELSLATALIGAGAGFVLAYGAQGGGLSPRYRGFLLSFSGVASNFAGVPLAFAFIATLGRMGLLTALVSSVFGLDLYGKGFSLYGFWGLCLSYVYFQVPLMVIVITPAIRALRDEWREAARSLGASRFRYWAEIGFPILAPALCSSILLLFGNAFGAYATAYALTGGMLNLVTILIGSQIRGDVLHNPNAGYALATGMVVIMAVTGTISNALKKKSSRWLA